MTDAVEAASCVGAGAATGRRPPAAGAAGAGGADAAGAVTAGRDGVRGGGVAAGVVPTSLAGRLVTRPALAERAGSTDGRTATAGAGIFPGSSAGVC
ncbi:MAG: hypothetical protein ABSC00_03105 [Acidimicrobiales bacterium]